MEEEQYTPPSSLELVELQPTMLARHWAGEVGEEDENISCVISVSRSELDVSIKIKQIYNYTNIKGEPGDKGLASSACRSQPSSHPSI